MPFGKLFSSSKSKNAGGQNDGATKKKLAKPDKLESAKALIMQLNNIIIKPNKDGIVESVCASLRDNPKFAKAIVNNQELLDFCCNLNPMKYRNQVLDELYPYVTSVSAMLKLINNRFGVNVENTKKRWTLDALRAMYPNLSRLPKDHINGIFFTTSGTHTIAHSIAGTEGTAWQDTHKVNGADVIDKKNVKIKYGMDLSAKTDVLSHRIGRAVNFTMYDKKDRMNDLNGFDTTLIHEIGHNVDEISTDHAKYSSLSSFRNLDGIEWKEYKKEPISIDKMVDDLCATYSDAAWSDMLSQIQVTALELNPYKAAKLVLSDLVNSEKGFGESRVKNRLAVRGGSYAKKDVNSKMAKAILKSKVYSVLEHGRANNNPYLKGAFGGGTRQYAQGYEGRAWFSYNTASLGDKISRYQMRDPGEDFAETYALYYTASQKLSSHRRMWFRSTVLKKPASRVKFHAMTGVDPLTGEKGPLDLTQQP